MMPPLQWDRKTCPEADPFLREWIETDGCGGYATSTILHCHTRKYHGLLVANLANPPGRHVLLSKYEDSLAVAGREHFFSCHRYPGVVFPDPPLLVRFRQTDGPRFTYETGRIRVETAIFLVPGAQEVLVRYDIAQMPGRGVLRLKPLLAFRHHHAIARENGHIRPSTEEIPNGFGISPYEGMPSLWFRSNIRSAFHASPAWYYRFVYALEAERGYAGEEDLFCPGVLEIPVRAGSTVVVSASTQPRRSPPLRTWRTEERRRAAATREITSVARKGAAGAQDRALLSQLMRAGRQCLVRNGAGKPAIIAGYPWFADWGRDTLISLPGLTFLSGRSREGVEILLRFGDLERQGLLPNCLSENGDHAYNTVDASLWYFWAVREMRERTGDEETVRIRLWPVLKRILRAFFAGTAFNIYVGDTGLLHAGGPSTQLTWMDAVIGERPVTPRWGYAVEINALWHHALCFAAELAAAFRDDEFPFADIIPKVRRSFNDTFWVAEGYLGDVFCNGFLDRSIRPNQIFAASLNPTLLPAERRRAIVETVRNHLLTPCGLRTLSPEDPRYRSRYAGDARSRDGAYHQGTVWPWFFDHFGEALLRCDPDCQEAQTFLRRLLRLFLSSHLPDAGMGAVSEVFDGDEPHRPGGCILQAWSVAAAIRLYDLLLRPPSEGRCPQGG